MSQGESETGGVDPANSIGHSCAARGCEVMTLNDGVTFAPRSAYTPLGRPSYVAQGISSYFKLLYNGNSKKIYVCVCVTVRGLEA